MTITWRPKAAEDFEQLILTASKFSTAEASRRKSDIETRIQMLERFKEMGSRSRRAGVREYPIAGTPYVVINRRQGDDILILRIFEPAYVAPKPVAPPQR